MTVRKQLAAAEEKPKHNPFGTRLVAFILSAVTVAVIAMGSLVLDARFAESQPALTIHAEYSSVPPQSPFCMQS